MNIPYDYTFQLMQDGSLVVRISDPEGSTDKSKTTALTKAALVRAAPDLLEALEQMMVCFDDGVGQPWNAKQLDAARAAIARAKGEGK